MKKKLLAMILAASLSAGMAVPAYALVVPGEAESAADSMAEVPAGDLEERVMHLYEDVKGIYEVVDYLCLTVGMVSDQASQAAAQVGDTLDGVAEGFSDTFPNELTEGQKQVVTDITDVVDAVFKLADDVYAEAGLNDTKVDLAAGVWETLKDEINAEVFVADSDAEIIVESIPEEMYEEDLSYDSAAVSDAELMILDAELTDSGEEMEDLDVGDLILDEVNFEDMTLEEQVAYLEGSVEMFDMVEQSLISYLRDDLGLGMVLGILGIDADAAAADSSAEAAELTLEERVDVLETKISRVRPIMDVINEVITLVS